MKFENLFELEEAKNENAFSEWCKLAENLA